MKRILNKINTLFGLGSVVVSILISIITDCIPEEFPFIKKWIIIIGSGVIFALILILINYWLSLKSSRVGKKLLVSEILDTVIENETYLSKIKNEKNSQKKKLYVNKMVYNCDKVQIYKATHNAEDIIGLIMKNQKDFLNQYTMDMTKECKEIFNQLID